MKSNCGDDRPCVAVLTPVGRGAVAVVAMTGSDSIAIVSTQFFAASGKPLADTTMGQIVFGRWGGDQGEEVVVVCRQQAVEVHCHGGLAASRAIVDDLTAAGCRQVDPADWLSATTSDAIEVAARLALAEAKTERAALHLLDQSNGALRKGIEQAAEAIATGATDNAASMLDDLLARGDFGIRLTKPARVVLTGPPNVGKSSLINALVGYERAIVFDTPGTTRDVVTAITAIDGWAIELIDTAGLRKATSDIEHQGIELAKSVLAEADVVLRVTEAAHRLSALPPAEEEFDRWLAGKRVIEVANKIDLLSEPQRQGLAGQGAPSLVLTSAATGEGVDALLAALAAQVTLPDQAVGTAIPFTHCQLDTLRTARRLLSTGDAQQAKQLLLAML